MKTDLAYGHVAPGSRATSGPACACSAGEITERCDVAPGARAEHLRLVLADDTISTLPFDEPRYQRAPIDLFFRSLAEQQKDGMAYAIVLTGAGADGAIGVKAIKESGGIVLVQDPSDAEFPSMPRSAITLAAPLP